MIELSQERDRLEGLLGLDRLLTLDEFWTAYLNQAEPQDVARDLPSLEALVGELREGLFAAKVLARSVAAELEGMSDRDVAGTLDRLLNGSCDDWVARRDQFTQSLGSLGLRRSLIGACIYVDQMGEEEDARLVEKLGRLQRAEFEPGDFPVLTKCLLELAKVACNLAWCFTGHIGCVIGGGTAFIGVLALIDRWQDKKSHCRDAGKELAEWLRDRHIEIPDLPEELPGPAV